MGSTATLECIVDAYPIGISYWTRRNDKIISDKRHKMAQLDLNESLVHLQLNISDIVPDDLGEYQCVSKNEVNSTIAPILLLGRSRAFSGSRILINVQYIQSRRRNNDINEILILRKISTMSYIPSYIHIS